jgi:hypothetical protein
MSPIRQNGGAKLTEPGVESSQSWQARVEGQVLQRCNAVAYSKLNRGTTPPLGSMPTRSIILETQIDRWSVAVDTDIMTLSPSSARQEQR